MAGVDRTAGRDHGSSGRAAGRRLGRRLALWLPLGLLVVAAGLVIGLLGAVEALERPVVRDRALARLAAATGLRVEIEAASLSLWSGVELGGLRLRSPPADARFAPDLLQIDALQVGWGLGGLLAGRLRLAPLRIQGLRLHLVRDAAGHSSLDRLLPAADRAEPAPAPGVAPDEPVPLSALLERGLPPLAVAELDISGVELELLEVDGDRLLRRTRLGPLGVAGRLSTLGGGFDCALRAGGLAPEGVRLVIEREPGTPAARRRTARLAAVLELKSAAPGAIALELAAAVEQQQLDPGWPASGPLARMAARLDFDPQAGRTRLRVTELDLLDGAVRGELDASLLDRGPEVDPLPVLDRARLVATSEAVPGLARLLPAGMELRGGRLELEATDLRPPAGGDLPGQGRLGLKLSAAAAGLPAAGQRLALERLEARLDAELGAAAGPALELGLSAERLERTGSAAAAVDGLQVSLDVEQLRPALADPLASRGRFALNAAARRLEAEAGGQRATVRGWRLEAAGQLDGGPPFALQGRMPVTEIAIDGGPAGRAELHDLLLGWRLSGLRPDFSAPAKLAVELDLGRLNATGRGRRLRLSGLDGDLTAVVRGPTALDLKLALPIARLRAAAGGDRVDLRGLELALDADDLSWPAGEPARAGGRLRLQPAVRRLEARTTGLAATARRVRLDLELALAGGSPAAISGGLDCARLAANDPRAGARLLAAERVRLEWRTSRLQLDLQRPERSRLALRIGGRIERVQPGADDGFSLRRLDWRIASGGLYGRLDSRLEFALAELRLDGRQLEGELNGRLKADWRPRPPRLVTALAIDGPAGPRVELSADGSFDPAERRLRLASRGRFERLGPLAALLPAALTRRHRLNWERLGLRFEQRGWLAGVVRGFAGWRPRWAAEPLARAAGEQHLELVVSGLDYGGAGFELDSPELVLKLDGRRERERLRAEIRLDSPRLTAVTRSGPEAAEQRLSLTGLGFGAELAGRGRPDSGRLQLQLALGADRVEQPWLAGYPIGRLALRARGSLERMEALRVEEVALDNPAAGTRLRLRAAVDRLRQRLAAAVAPAAGEPADDRSERIPGRQALTLSGEWTQRLDGLGLLGDDAELAGTVRLPFEIESGDLKAFRLAGLIECAEVRAALPGAGLELAGLNGQVPILEDVALRPGAAPELLPGPPGNPYARARFADVHPFLRGDHYLALERLRAAGLELGPLAGNLRISWDTFALDQLELGAGGGRVTGQLVAEGLGGEPVVHFKGNATGIRPSGGEQVLDANANLRFQPDPLGLSGRVQVVRISSQHLLAALDWIDPYRANPDINKIRMALKIGYPEYVRIQMRDGLLSAAIELGGVAGVVRIDEIRGIPLGPILERYIAPVLDGGGKP
jgi:translocation and assembly module TamB